MPTINEDPPASDERSNAVDQAQQTLQKQRQKNLNPQQDEDNNAWGGRAPGVDKTPKNQQQEKTGNTRSDKSTPQPGSKNKMPGKIGNGLATAGQALNTAKRFKENPGQTTKQLAGAALDRAKEMLWAKIAEGLAAATFGLSLLLKNKTARKIIFMIAGAIIAAIFILFFIIISVFFSLGGYSANQQYQNNNTNSNPNANTFTLTLSKEAPQNVPNGTDIPYKVVYAFNGSGQDLTITDKLPDNVTMVSYPPTAQYDATTKTLTWKRSNNQPVAAGTGGLFTQDQLTGNFSFTVHPNNDAYISNKITGVVTGGDAGAGSSGQELPPVATDCNGAYKDIFALNTNIPLFQYKTTPNFGDPDCSFTKFASGPTDPAVLDNLYQQIKDALTATNSPPDDLKAWQSIIPCESSYDANNFQPKSKSGYGAYGLFQMNPHYVPTANGSPALDPRTNLPLVSGNTPYDRGDVNWKLQVKNAINQNTLSTCKWTYWSCAPKALTDACINPGNSHPAN